MKKFLQKIHVGLEFVLIKVFEKIIFPVRNYFSEMEMESYGWKVKKSELWGFKILIPPTAEKLREVRRKSNIFYITSTAIIVILLIILTAYTFIYFLS